MQAGGHHSAQYENRISFLPADFSPWGVAVSTEGCATLHGQTLVCLLVSAFWRASNYTAMRLPSLPPCNDRRRPGGRGVLGDPCTQKTPSNSMPTATTRWWDWTPKTSVVQPHTTAHISNISDPTSIVDARSSFFWLLHDAGRGD